MATLLALALLAVRAGRLQRARAVVVGGALIAIVIGGMAVAAPRDLTAARERLAVHRRVRKRPIGPVPAHRVAPRHRRDPRPAAGRLGAGRHSPLGPRLRGRAARRRSRSRTTATSGWRGSSACPRPGCWCSCCWWRCCGAARAGRARPGGDPWRRPGRTGAVAPGQPHVPCLRGARHHRSDGRAGCACLRPSGGGRVMRQLVAVCLLPLALALPHRGFNFTTWWHDEYASPHAAQSLSQLAATGANSVALVPSWYQQSRRSTRIRARRRQKPDGPVRGRRSSRARRSLGLRVFLRPTVETRDGTPRSELRPRSRARLVSQLPPLHPALRACSPERSGSTCCRSGSSTARSTVRARRALAARDQERSAPHFKGPLDLRGQRRRRLDQGALLACARRHRHRRVLPALQRRTPAAAEIARRWTRFTDRFGVTHRYLASMRTLARTPPQADHVHGARLSQLCSRRGEAMEHRRALLGRGTAARPGWRVSGAGAPTLVRWSVRLGVERRSALRRTRRHRPHAAGKAGGALDRELVPEARTVRAFLEQASTRGWAKLRPVRNRRFVSRLRHDPARCPCCCRRTWTTP